jgi:hypothetical protein
MPLCCYKANPPGCRRRPSVRPSGNGVLVTVSAISRCLGYHHHQYADVVSLNKACCVPSAANSLRQTISRRRSLARYDSGPEGARGWRQHPQDSAFCAMLVGTDNTVGSLGEWRAAAGACTSAWHDLTAMQVDGHAGRHGARLGTECARWQR